MNDLELIDIPSRFGLQKNFSIQSLKEPKKTFEKVLKKNIIAYDCFSIGERNTKGYYLVVVLYRKGNKELFCLKYHEYRYLSQALKKKVDNKYM